MLEDSVCKSEEFEFPVSRPDDRTIPSGRSNHPVRTPICPLLHPSGQRAIPPGRHTDQHHPSGRRVHSVRTLYYNREGSTNLHPSRRFSSTSGRLSVLDQFQISFQVPRKGRSINRPDDVVSRPDTCLLKSRIAIQISPSGHQSALVQTRVLLIWKLPI
jgi:hypothetical protein